MTTNNPAPKDYSTVCPYLMVDSIEVQLDFMKIVFNAVIKEKLKNDEGIIMHGEVKIGDTVIMMGRGSERFPSMQGMNYVYVINADDVYNKAIEIGSEPIASPSDKFYGLREGGFKDTHGNIWFIAQFIKDVSVEDMEKGFADKKS